MSIVEDKPAATRPSLYAAIRLARLVLNFRARLKARVQRRGLSIKPFIADQKESFKIQAYKAINRQAAPCRLLGDIDSYAKPGSLSVTTVAAQDSLFLQHDVQKLANGLSIVGLRHLLDRIILVLEALQSLKNARAEPQGTSARDLACHDYTCEKFIANLEHLLQCLGDVVFEAIIYHKQIEKEVDDLHWYKYWRQQRETDDGWFSEWPNSRHPLSTTWPWNVKPSLLVLWGVCWMFFDNEASNEGEDLGNGNNIWPQRQQPRRIANPNLSKRCNGSLQMFD
ncbi:hypothetical protein MMC12_001183 [Toensbergia leucococca]|nr:hypothetical protein [Toensbergia leucococca]